MIPKSATQISVYPVKTGLPAPGKPGFPGFGPGFSIPLAGLDDGKPAHTARGVEVKIVDDDWKYQHVHVRLGFRSADEESDLLEYR